MDLMDKHSILSILRSSDWCFAFRRLFRFGKCNFNGILRFMGPGCMFVVQVGIRVRFDIYLVHTDVLHFNLFHVFFFRHGHVHRVSRFIPR